MGLSRGFIDGVLKHRAYDIAYHVAQHWPAPGTNKLKYHDYNYGFEWDVIDGGVEFYPGGNKGTKIRFKNIRVAKISKITYGDPQKRNEESDDANIKKFCNYSSRDIERTYTLSKEETQSTVSSETIGVEVMTGLEATVGYAAGDAGGAYGSVTLKTEVTTSWEQFVEKSNSSTKGTEDSFKVVVPPKKRIIVTATTNKADILQPITVVGEIDFDIEIECPDQWVLEFVSINNFETFIEGMLPRGTHKDYHSKVENYVKANPHHFKVKREGLTTTYSKEIQYQGAAAGDIVVTEEDLK